MGQQVGSGARGSDTSNRNGRMVSASEIARLAYCERQIRLDAVRGRRTSPQQREAQHRGEAAHRGFYEESRRLAERSEYRGKCFIATLALGHTRHTLVLRQFRDLFLRRSPWGRALIAAYYRYSPRVCVAMADRPRLLQFTRGPLKLLARVAALAVRRRLEKEQCDDRISDRCVGRRVGRSLRTVPTVHRIDGR